MKRRSPEMTEGELSPDFTAFFVLPLSMIRYAEESFANQEKGSPPGKPYHYLSHGISARVEIVSEKGQRQIRLTIEGDRLDLVVKAIRKKLLDSPLTETVLKGKIIITWTPNP
jgi:hypothetical protein